MNESIRIRTIYRTLLRTIGHSVRFQKQHVKNLRRILRDDFDQILQSGVPMERIEERVSQTMLFHLSSLQSMPSKDQSEREVKNGQSSTFPTRDAIASRVMLNLSAICYHNLSPNTVMQSEKVGGSDTSIMRKIRSQRNLTRKETNRKSTKEVEQEDQNLMNFDLTNPTEIGDLGSKQINSLLVSPRKQRGPKVGPSESRQFRIREWNGQKDDAHLRNSSITIDNLRKSIEGLQELYDKSKDQKELEKIGQQLKTQKSKLKTLVRPFEAQKNLIKIRNDTAALFYSIVQKAEKRSEVLLGSARIGKWAKGEWLPP